MNEPTESSSEDNAALAANSSVTETEEELVQEAQQAVSRCNWVVGHCAAKWTEKYARGRTDADFAGLVGLSPDQVYQRRRVWETFGDVQDDYPSLKWSHFYVSLNWDDAPECLQWAEENQTTVKEMKVWRRALRGDDLDEPDPEEWGSDSTISQIPTEISEVRNPEPRGDSAGSSRESEGAIAIADGKNDPGGPQYAPFRKNATNPGPQGTETESSDKPIPTTGQLLKRMVVTLERINRELTPERAAQIPSLPEKVRERFRKVMEELNNAVDGQFPAVEE